ncbi:MAG: sigma-54-dependent transcriptional regulator [Calditrichaceae bacterium]
MHTDQIIIVEDNDSMRMGMAESLRREGYPVFEFTEGAHALEHMKSHPAALVITDLKMEPMDGLAVLKKVREKHPDTEVLMVSAYGTVNVAVDAMRMGAVDFMTKPFSNDELRIRVKNILQKVEKDRLINRLRDVNEYLLDEISSEYEQIIGSSPPMLEIFRLIDKIAKEESVILIEGESGTGKELVARAIHRKSKRSDQSFVRVNCGALNDNLLESELFGHEKGAFTGAVRRKKGRFELADGGTLFLDEIGDISPNMQVKLLRAIQEKEFERVGGEKTLKVNVRIIAATNKNLQKLIAAGKFREDLFYRLSVIPVKLPALRQRKDDIPLLIDHFLEKQGNKGSLKKTFSSRSISLLQDYSWPGNIRELENLIERLCVISQESEIEAETVASYISGFRGAVPDQVGLPLEEALYSFEKNLIQQAMKNADGVKNQAAKLLGIRTSTLYYKLEKFGMIE